MSPSGGSRALCRGTEHLARVREDSESPACALAPASREHGPSLPGLWEDKLEKKDLDRKTDRMRWAVRAKRAPCLA